jgi:hypothetical protein
VPKAAPPGQQRSERGPKRERRRAVKQERRPIDAPLRQGGYDAGDLIGESQFSAEQAGERITMRPRWSGGPPSEDFTATSASDLGRRYLEEATQSPGHEHYEPNADLEIEPETESSWDPEEEAELQSFEDELSVEEEEEEPRGRR